MNSVIQNMIDSYNCRTTEDYKNALKEIVQEITLLGLYRGGFFNNAAFYGGSALRIFYGLDRFSEDLDFSLLTPDKNFNLSKYTPFVKDELGAYGLEMSVEEKIKQNDSQIKSAFIKGGTQIHLLKITSITPPVSGVNPDEMIKIKLEVDTDPPPGAEYELKYLLQPIPFSVNIFKLSSLFAGKVHAILCRNWKTRVKGRDYYDYVWYLSKKIPLNIKHLSNRISQSCNSPLKEPINEETLKQMLFERFSLVDFKQVKDDIIPFINDPESLNVWSKEFFISITKDKLVFEL